MLFPLRITQEHVIEAQNIAAHRFPGRKIQVLGDEYLQTDAEFFNCSTHCPSDLDIFDYANTAFVYACEQDDVGYPFVDRIIAMDGRFIPAMIGIPASYIHRDIVARKALEEEYALQQAENFIKWDHHDFVNLTQAMRVTADIDGDYVEIGCYEGSSASATLCYLRDKQIARNCYILDVFDGFTYEGAAESADALWLNSHATSGVERVSARLKRHETDSLKINVIKSNIITDDLPEAISQICVANIDVDMYEAVYVALTKVAPLMAKGGIIIAEDPGHTPMLIGAECAIQRFLREDSEKKFMPLYMQSGQVFLIRR